MRRDQYENWGRWITALRNAHRSNLKAYREFFTHVLTEDAGHLVTCMCASGALALAVPGVRDRGDTREGPNRDLAADKLGINLNEYVGFACKVVDMNDGSPSSIPLDLWDIADRVSDVRDRLAKKEGYSTCELTQT